MTDLMGERGVNAFSGAALELGWIVRRQHESDQGIDAEIERVIFKERKKGPPRELATGRLIAVQIKGGKSWFRSPTKTGGWWFSFSERERNLWLNHALPVIVALYHPEHRQVYWQRISPATTTKAKTRYRVEVPANQTVNGANDAWIEIASGDEQRALSRFELSIQGVSPLIAKNLKGRNGGDHADAAVLAMHLADGKLNPRGTATALLTAKPRWITDHAAWTWPLVAHFCSDHRQMDLAADAYELGAAAADGEAKSRMLAAAATHRVSDDVEAARDILAQLEKLPGSAVLRAVTRTVVTNGQLPLARWAFDPILLEGGPELDASAPAQRLLATRSRLELEVDRAVDHAEKALALEPHSSETMVLTADCLLLRWSTHGAGSADLARGCELLQQALTQRIAWAGPTIEVRRELVRSLAAAGHFEQVLRLALPPPYGTAASTETDTVVMRTAAVAAAILDRRPEVDLAVGFLGDSPEDRLAMARAGVVEFAAEELRTLRILGLEQAQSEEHFAEIAQFGLALAEDGVDVTDRLRPYVEAGHLPAQLLRLCSALLLRANSGLEAALPSLRELAKEDGIAAEHLLGFLRRAGRYTEAATQAHQLFELTGSPQYLLHQARALIGAHDDEKAVRVALEVVALNDARPHDRAELLTFLGSVAGQKEDWAGGEKYFTQAIDLVGRPGPELVWNLVICQVQQGRVAKAAQTVARHNPQVRDQRDAKLWLSANAATTWDTATAMEAFSLAQRFDDPELCATLAGAIITRTHGVGGEGDEPDELASRRRAAQKAVPGELHRQAFEFIAELVERHGEATGIKVLSGTDEELVALMIEELKTAAAADEARGEIIGQVRAGRIPLGLLAALLGRGHATLEVQRAMGARLAGAVAEDEHDVEVQTAREAINTSVVVDTAVVITLTGCEDPNQYAGRFLGLLVPPSAMLDLHRLSDDVRSLAGSPGTLRWDESRRQVVASDLSDEEFMRQLRRAEAVERYVDRLVVRTPGAPTVYSELDRTDRATPWRDTLQLANDEAAVVWSDDLGMRRAARGAGLKAFSTPALVDALRDIAIEAGSSEAADVEAIRETVRRNLELARDHVVDLPIAPEDLLVLATDDDWHPRAAAVALSRPSFWMWNDRAFAALAVVYKEARIHAPETLVEWQFAAMHGAGQLASREAAAAVLALLAMVGFGLEPSDQERADSLRRARQVASGLELPDPIGGLPRAAQTIADGGACDDPEELVKRIMALLDDSPEHRA
jgi:uncharacterized protein DUF4365/TPR-GreAB-C-PIN type conflict system protein